MSERKVRLVAFVNYNSGAKGGPALAAKLEQLLGKVTPTEDTVFVELLGVGERVQPWRRRSRSWFAADQRAWRRLRDRLW